MSPTTLFASGADMLGHDASSGVRGRGVPGVWYWVGYWEGLYRVLTQDPPRTHIELNLALRPYLRPNEG